MGRGNSSDRGGNKKVSKGATEVGEKTGAAKG